MFQGAEGAEAAADPPGPLGGSAVSGFWWVLVGSGGFWRVLGGFWVGSGAIRGYKGL